MLQSMMQQKPGVVVHVVTACVILRNMLNTRSVRGHFQPENTGLNVNGGL